MWFLVDPEVIFRRDVRVVFGEHVTSIYHTSLGELNSIWGWLYESCRAPRGIGGDDEWAFRIWALNEVVEHMPDSVLDGEHATTAFWDVHAKYVRAQPPCVPGMCFFC